MGIQGRDTLHPLRRQNHSDRKQVEASDGNANELDAAKAGTVLRPLEVGKVGRDQQRKGPNFLESANEDPDSLTQLLGTSLEHRVRIAQLMGLKRSGKFVDQIHAVNEGVRERADDLSLRILQLPHFRAKQRGLIGEHEKRAQVERDDGCNRYAGTFEPPRQNAKDGTQCEQSKSPHEDCFLPAILSSLELKVLCGAIEDQGDQVISCCDVGGFDHASQSAG